MITFYQTHTSDLVCHASRPQGSLQVAAHLHRHIELAMLLEGHTVAYDGTERYQLEPGDVFISFPNHIHRFETVDQERYILMIVNPDLMPELAHTFLSFSPRSARVPGAARDPQLLQIAEALVASTDDTSPYADQMRRGYLQVFFSKLLSQMELTESPYQDSQALKTVIAYCSAHYQSELSLGLLERELHISKYYISHLFSDKLRIGFNNYLNSLRLSYACDHLCHSDASITEIAEKAGFGTARTFNRAFLKQMGCTPSEYRQGKRPQNGAPARK
ncbi:MAG: AraC family transcriptional regulator [Clostridia bacterium]|nr:AraC family transcriptional regulator [Clostridia bacterium]